MSRKPYYVLSAKRVSRVSGGFENVYTISVKGWGKIRYFAGQSIRVQEPVPVQPPQMGGSFLLGASRIEVERDFRLPYLVMGKGTAEEYELLGIPHDGMAADTPIESTRPANISGIMAGLNSGYLCVEGFCGVLRRNVGFKEFDFAFRMAGLQTLGLTPGDTCAPFYANAARYLGATKEEIYIALLARRCFELGRRVHQVEDGLGRRVHQLEDDLSKTNYDSMMKRIELRLESVRELFELEKRLRSELLDHENFLKELFLKLNNLESIIPDHYWKSRINKILYAIIEFEISTLKRQLSAGN